MTAYNPPQYSGISSFITLFFTSTNKNNYLIYPVSQQTNKIFLGSVNVNQGLVVSGTTNLGAATGSTVQNSNNLSYYFPMIPSTASGIKALYTDTNWTLKYNPYSDTLTVNYFKANKSISTISISNNNYLG